MARAVCAVVLCVVVVGGGCALDVDADFGAFAKGCDADDDCGEFVCVDGVCVKGAEGEGDVGEGEGEGEGDVGEGEGEGEGEGDPCDDAALATAPGDLFVDSGNAIDVGHVERDLIIGSPAALNLPNLCTVGRDLILDEGVRLESLTLPQLRSVGGRILVREAADLVAVDLPLLSTVADNIEIGVMEIGRNAECPDNDALCVLFHGNPELAQIRLPALESVGGRFRVVANPKLRQVEAEHAFTVGKDVIVSSNFTLGTLALGVTSAKRMITIDDNPKLRALSLPLLTEVREQLPLDDDEVITRTLYSDLANGSLYMWTSSFDGVGPDQGFQEIETVDVPLLRDLDGGLTITDVVVANLRFPELRTVDSIYLHLCVGSDNVPGHSGIGLQTFEAPLLVTPADRSTGLRGVGPGLFRTSSTDDNFSNCTGDVSLCVERNFLMTGIVLGSTTSLAGGVTLQDNSVLNDVCTLGDLEEADSMFVNRNPALTSLSFLNNLSTLHGELSITDNSVLPACQATLISGLVNGETSFSNSGNGPGDCTAGIPACTE